MHARTHTQYTKHQKTYYKVCMHTLPWCSPVARWTNWEAILVHLSLCRLCGAHGSGGKNRSEGEQHKHISTLCWQHRTTFSMYTSYHIIETITCTVTYQHPYHLHAVGHCLKQDKLSLTPNVDHTTHPHGVCHVSIPKTITLRTLREVTILYLVAIIPLWSSS